MRYHYQIPEKSSKCILDKRSPCLMRVVAEQQLPFTLKVPNAETRAAMAEAVVRDHALLLQCLAILHENFRLYYEADLANKDEDWKVIQIREVIIKRHEP